MGFFTSTRHHHCGHYKGKSSHDCVWVNQYGKGKVFGTTLGHHNETMQAKEYLDMVSNGILWATDRLK